MIKTGIAVFAYDRAEHLEKVLNGLSRNKEVDKVYIFHDGLKCEADRKEWERVRTIIDSVEWCEKVLNYSDINKGLADSIIDGINLVLGENEAVIVLEDDCVPQPAFMSFMLQCFEQYQYEKRVMSISGYSWTFVDTRKDVDIYFSNRPCSWGWGTWKDRWGKYGRDANIIKEIKRDKAASKRLATYGDDLEEMMIHNINGVTDSWYVFWALKAIKENYVCINPYLSLINNVGFDGTGVHCGTSEKFDCKEFDTRDSETNFALPNTIEIKKETEESFARFYGNEVVINSTRHKEKVLLYGVGVFCKANINQIANSFEITALVDAYKKDLYYAGFPIIRPKQIGGMEYDYIIVMLENIDLCNNVRRELSQDYDIAIGKIMIGIDILEGDFRKMYK